MIRGGAVKCSSRGPVQLLQPRMWNHSYLPWGSSTLALSTVGRGRERAAQNLTPCGLIHCLFEILGQRESVSAEVPSDISNPMVIPMALGKLRDSQNKWRKRNVGQIGRKEE